MEVIDCVGGRCVNLPQTFGRRKQIVYTPPACSLVLAFHTNPIGSHLISYLTLHCLCLQYYWPGMYLYVKRMCAAWPGCALSNPTKSKSSELVYNFPIEAPFMVMHVDAYMAGAHSGFKGSETYIIACCGMCSFGTREPVTGANATTFASAIMKIQL